MAIVVPTDGGTNALVGAASNNELRGVTHTFALLLSGGGLLGRGLLLRGGLAVLLRPSLLPLLTLLSSNSSLLHGLLHRLLCLRAVCAELLHVCLVLLLLLSGGRRLLLLLGLLLLLCRTGSLLLLLLLLPVRGVASLTPLPVSLGLGLGLSLGLRLGILSWVEAHHLEWVLPGSSAKRGSTEA